MEISVIIPCYNAFGLMKRCLVALENQTFRDFEVIVVDDCSEDDSYIKLLDYSKSTRLQMSVCQTEFNVGPGEARNIAIKKASGRFLAFCDSDDWYNIDYLEKMYHALIRRNADIVMCNYQKVFDNGKSEKVIYTQELNMNQQSQYLALSKSSLCLLMLDKELFNNLEIPKLLNGEDIAIIPVLLGKANKIIHTNDILYNYYVRTNSLSNRPDKRIYKSLIQAFTFIEKNLDLKLFEEELEFIGIRTILYGCVLNAFKAQVENENIKQIVKQMEEKYPNWWRNKYLRNLGSFQHIFLWGVKKKKWYLIKTLTNIHRVYVSR